MVPARGAFAAPRETPRKATIGSGGMVQDGPRGAGLQAVSI
jgi:hypothetical protein